MCLVRPALLIDIHRLAGLQQITQQGTQQITQQGTQQGTHGGRSVMTGAGVHQRTLEDAFARDADGLSAANAVAVGRAGCQRAQVIALVWVWDTGRRT